MVHYGEQDTKASQSFDEKSGLVNMNVLTVNVCVELITRTILNHLLNSYHSNEELKVRLEQEAAKEAIQASLLEQQPKEAAAVVATQNFQKEAKAKPAKAAISEEEAKQAEEAATLQKKALRLLEETGTSDFNWKQTINEADDNVKEAVATAEGTIQNAFSDATSNLLETKVPKPKRNAKPAVNVSVFGVPKPKSRPPPFDERVQQALDNITKTTKKSKGA